MQLRTPVEEQATIGGGNSDKADVPHKKHGYTIRTKACKDRIVERKGDKT